MQFEVKVISATTILLVSGDTPALGTMGDALSQFGFHAARADSIETAREALAGTAVDILALDLSLPGAFEFAREFLGGDSYVECVGIGDFGRHPRLLSAAQLQGFTGFVSLPVAAESLPEVFYRCAERAYAVRAAEEKHPDTGTAILAAKNRELEGRLTEIDRSMKVAATLAMRGFSIDEKLHKSLVILLEQLQAERGSIMLVDEKHRELVVRASFPHKIVGARQPMDGTSIAAMVTRSGKAMNMELGETPVAFTPRNTADYKGSAFLTYPIAGNAGVLGVFNVTDRKTGRFTDEDEQTLSRFIDRIAVVIDNAVLQDRLRQDEAALRESEKRYRLLVESAPDPIVVHCDWKITYANRAALSFIRADRPEEVLGRSILDFIHHDYRQVVVDRLTSLIFQGLSTLPRAEQKYYRLDGSVADVEVSTTLVSQDGKPAVQSIFRDITERKRMDAELRAAKETAEEATKLKDKYVSLVSHDLRAPLASASGHLKKLEKMAGDALPPGQKGMLKNAIENQGKMIGMIDRLLDLSRLQTGNIMPRLLPTDMRAVALMAIDSIASLAGEKGVAISCEIPAGVKLSADRELLLEVIGNLLSNAVKFCREGDAVTVRMAPDRPNTIAVADTGTGISPKIIKDLFKQEVKTTTPGTAGEKGTGLGLPLCAEIIAAHGGSIAVESAVGKGSAFFVTLLPARKAVLVVDDHDVARQIVREHLRPLDVEVVEAENGRQALALIASLAPQLVIADVYMPEMDGFELLAQIRKNPKTSGLNVIMISGDASEERRDMAKTLGASDFVAKPLVDTDLIPRVKQFLS